MPQDIHRSGTGQSPLTSASQQEPEFKDPTTRGDQPPLSLNGPIETVHEGGRKKTVITYKDNLKHGEMLTVDLTTNAVLSRFTFENDQLNGPATLYQHGEVASVMYYKGGLLEGPMRVFASGILIVENIFEQGKQQGLSKTYSKSGLLITAANWQEGRKNGDARTFHDCGQVSQITPYVDDQIHGTQRHFDITGNLIQETEYLNDQRHGRSVTFYSNGKPMEIRHYKNDRLVGEPARFDPKGNPYRQP